MSLRVTDTKTNMAWEGKQDTAGSPTSPWNVTSSTLVARRQQQQTLTATRVFTTTAQPLNPTLGENLAPAHACTALGASGSSSAALVGNSQHCTPSRTRVNLTTLHRLSALSAISLCSPPVCYSPLFLLRYALSCFGNTNEPRS